MNKKHYEAAVKFGVQLIEQNDLDPIYVILNRSNIKTYQLMRLVLAYSCLYHLGGAAYISEVSGKGFWNLMDQAAANEDSPMADGRWPRGVERRHWRGMNAAASMAYFKSNFPLETPETIATYWYSQRMEDCQANMNFNFISRRIQQADGFGPWIAFKLVDIGERVLHYKIDFSNCQLGVYSEPLKGAGLIARGKMERATEQELQNVVNEMLFDPRLSRLKAPPHNDRPLNIQEIETILCKYKSHCNGHYEVGKDKHEVLTALEPRWGQTAQKLRAIAETL